MAAEGEIPPKERRKRRASVAGIFVASMCVVGGITTAAAIALALVQVEFDRLVAAAAEESNSMRAMGEIRYALFVYAREMSLLRATQAPANREAVERALQSIDGWLQVARENTVDGIDSLSLEEIARLLDEYVRDSNVVLRRRNAPLAERLEVERKFDAVVQAIERYKVDSQAAVNSTRDEITRLGRRLTEISVIAAVLLPLLILWLVLAARRAVFLPFRRVLAAQAEYAAGHTEERAPEEGPRELQEMARSFNHLADLLAEQHRSRSEFLLAVAHDLRNPLTALGGTIALGKRQLDSGELSPEKFQTQLGKITRLVSRLDRIASDLSDMSRVEAGRFELHMTPCDARELVDEVEELFADSTSTHPISIERSPVAVPVCCDPTRLSQVLNNLVSNAIKYSPEGGRIDLRVARRADKAVIEVEDRGIGLSPANLERIFIPFHRIHPQQVPGVGLGLSVARRLVVAQGGRIEVESTPGVGSIFRVVLPLAAECPPEAAAPEGGSVSEDTSGREEEPS